MCSWYFCLCSCCSCSCSYCYTCSHFFCACSYFCSCSYSYSHSCCCSSIPALAHAHTLLLLLLLLLSFACSCCSCSPCSCSSSCSYSCCWCCSTMMVWYGMVDRSASTSSWQTSTSLQFISHWTVTWSTLTLMRPSDSSPRSPAVPVKVSLHYTTVMIISTQVKPIQVYPR